MRHVDTSGACWLWTGQRGGKGRRYGYFRVGTKRTDHRTVAHRVAYELMVGPIPEGLQVDHVKARGCTSTLCVNPAHLEPVTRAENNARERLSLCSRGHDLSLPGMAQWDTAGRRRGCAECNRITSRDYQRRRAALNREG